MLKLKKKVETVGLKNEMIIVAEEAFRAFESYGHDAIITSALDGKHGDDSLHYEGYALDFRIKHLHKTKKHTAAMAREIVGRLKVVLGENYDVVLHETHIHVEYDPKVGGERFFALALSAERVS